MLLKLEVSGIVVIEFKDCKLEIYARFLEELHIFDEMEFIIKSVDYNNKTIIEHNNSDDLLILKLNNGEELQLYASEIFGYAIEPDLKLETIFEIERFKVNETILDCAKRLN